MISFDFDKIAPLCAEFCPIDAEIRERLTVYGNLLTEWNGKMNLTAITAPEDILYKHFYDCLLFFKHIPMPHNATVVDVGTGAGFPGMVLKIARPDLQLTLLDGLAKRLTFLEAVLNALGLTAETVHARAEDAGKDTRYRERFDVACARAVAALPVLTEYCVPFVKKGGLFVAMKGANASTEAAESAGALKILGCAPPRLFTETLTGAEQRSFITAKKISQTPTKYPRPNGKITKSALK